MRELEVQETIGSRPIANCTLLANRREYRNLCLSINPPAFGSSPLPQNPAQNITWSYKQMELTQRCLHTEMQLLQDGPQWLIKINNE